MTLVKKTRFLSVGFSLGLFLFTNIVLAQSSPLQPSNEVNVRPDGNARDTSQRETSNVSVDDDERLVVSMNQETCRPRKTDTCKTRIVCIGLAPILGTSPTDILIASKVAENRAKGNLSLYIGAPNKVQEDLKQLQTNYSKNSESEKIVSNESGQLYSYITSNSAENFLQGVSVIGGKVDLKSRVAASVIGQSCETVASAQAISNEMRRGEALRSGPYESPRNVNRSGGTRSSDSSGSFENKPLNNF